MRCCDVEALWDELRGCEARSNDPVFIHLKACLHCRDVFAANDALIAAIKALPDVVPPEDLCARVLQHVKQRCSPSRCTDGLAEIESPLGRLFVAFGSQAISYVWLDQESPRETVIERMEQRLRRFVKPADAPDWVCMVVEQFFTNWTTNLERVDTTSLTEFEAAALLAASRIPAGEVRSYGWIAREIGRPNSARAVGQAMARNPIAVLLPCHRVVDSAGRLHNYAYGLTLKAKLLELEGYLRDAARSKVLF